MTPKRIEEITELRRPAARSPTATPTTANPSPWRTTIPVTDGPVAPRAIRTPISFLRWATMYEITP